MPVDERVMRGVAAQYIRTEKTDDMSGAGAIIVMACRLPRPTSLQSVVHASQAKSAASDLTWDTRSGSVMFGRTGGAQSCCARGWC